MIFVNFKTYRQGTGVDAVNLTKILEEVANQSQVKIIVVVQVSDIREVVQTTKLEVWSQKIDPINYGAHTGGILPEAVLEDGASGTFLNHSEAKMLDFENLKMAVKRCGEVGLKTLIFASTLEELEKICDLEPTYVAYEPPELIGSSTNSVAQAQPEVVEEAAKLSKEKGIPLVVGAGVNSSQDVRISLLRGAVGVAVASDIMKAEDPQKEISELVSGFEDII